jgi:hypothetical protein
MPTTIARPDPAEYSPALADYIRLVPEGDLLATLAAQADDLAGLVAKLSDAQALTRHPPYTWSIKQVVGHLIDCERVFGYRAMRLARNDATPLAGFDENAYMRFVDFDRYPIAELATEFDALRRSHLALFRHLDPDALLRTAIVNGSPITVRAIAHVMAGHTAHHLAILHARLEGYRRANQ